MSFVLGLADVILFGCLLFCIGRRRYHCVYCSVIIMIVVSITVVVAMIVVIVVTTFVVTVGAPRMIA